MSEQQTPKPETVHDESTGRDFTIGGNAKGLTPDEEWEQLRWYIKEHYPRPDMTAPWLGGEATREDLDRFFAHLPDRIMHASMLMLGSAVDHTVPGVAWTTSFDIDVTEWEDPHTHTQAVIYTPLNPTGTWTVTVHGGGFWHGAGADLENAWRPDVAALAVTSGTTVIDVDYPLAPEHTLHEQLTSIEVAIAHAQRSGATAVYGYGLSAGAALVAAAAAKLDKLVLNKPLLSLDSVPAEIRAGVDIPPATTWPDTLIQISTHDGKVPRRPDIEQHVTAVSEYPACHIIATPTVQRARLLEAASFLADKHVTDPRHLPKGQYGD